MGKRYVYYREREIWLAVYCHVIRITVALADINCFLIQRLRPVRYVRVNRVIRQFFSVRLIYSKILCMPLGTAQFTARYRISSSRKLFTTFPIVSCTFLRPLPLKFSLFFGIRFSELRYQNLFAKLFFLPEVDFVRWLNPPFPRVVFPFQNKRRNCRRRHRQTRDYQLTEYLM